MRDMGAIIAALGGPARANVEVGIARGEPGQVHPLLRGMSTAELAELDRYSQAALMSESVPAFAAPVMGTAVTGIAAANEASKLIPGAQDAIGRIMEMMGRKGEEFQTVTSGPKRTSKPSLGNVAAAARGFLAGQTGY